MCFQFIGPITYHKNVDFRNYINNIDNHYMVSPTFIYLFIKKTHKNFRVHHKILHGAYRSK